MARFTGYEPCPKCRSQGRDRRGDNLGTWDDGSLHCFSCGFHRAPKFYVREVKKDGHGSKDKAVLPYDFTREVPARAWKWLLQYGLPYTYWKPFVGWSERDDRLVFTVGEPVKFSIGRYIAGGGGQSLVREGGRGNGSNPVGITGGPAQRSQGALDSQRNGQPAKQKEPRKWFFWGDGHGYVDVLEPQKERASKVVLVEDLISAHKVAQVENAICLFGTNIHDVAIKSLIALKQPVTLWLDADQRALLPGKINRLQSFLRHPVRYVSTEKDPKEYSVQEIKEILNGS